MSFISDLFAGGIAGILSPISKITGQIADAKIAAIRASTDVEKTHADERVRMLEGRRDVLIAEAGDRSNRWMRIWIALGPSVVLNKIYIWDKAFGQVTGGRTDALDENLWWVITSVIGFYFLADASARIARLFKR